LGLGLFMTEANAKHTSMQRFILIFFSKMYWPKKSACNKKLNKISDMKVLLKKSLFVLYT